jgi:hypothetical protein
LYSLKKVHGFNYDIINAMQIFLSLFLVFTSLYGVADLPTDPGSDSVELRIAELSPMGEVGGYAVPASGCGSAGGGRHSHGRIVCDPPTITADKVLVRRGTEVGVTWTTGGWPGCVLSDKINTAESYDVEDPAIDRMLESTAQQMYAAGYVPRKGTYDATITGEATFSINCGAGGSDSVTVYILTELEES